MSVKIKDMGRMVMNERNVDERQNINEKLNVRRSRKIERMNVDCRAKELHHIASLTHQMRYTAVESKRGNVRNHIVIAIVPQ